MRDPVGHAAFVFTPKARVFWCAFIGDRAGDHVVQKAAIVADQKYGAFVVLQQVFQEFEGVNVQIVRWFIEHQHVGWTGEKAGQQQAVAFAARERSNRRIGASWREQEVRQVALDMFFLAIDLDPFAAGADEVFESCIKIKRIAHLVEISHLQIGALANLAGRCRRVRLQLTEDELEQGRFSGAVRSQQTNLVTAQQGAGEVADNDFFRTRMAEAQGDIGQLGDDLAALLATGDVQIHAADHIASG